MAAGLWVLGWALVREVRTFVTFWHWGQGKTWECNTTQRCVVVCGHRDLHYKPMLWGGSCTVGFPRPSGSTHPNPPCKFRLENFVPNGVPQTGQSYLNHKSWLPVLAACFFFFFKSLSFSSSLANLDPGCCPELGNTHSQETDSRALAATSRLLDALHHA